jgi:4-hydroxybenzoate polyprenyltransferase
VGLGKEEWMWKRIKMEKPLLNFLLGLGIGICVIAAYLMFKGWIETAVVVLIMGIIMIGISATIRRTKKKPS